MVVHGAASIWSRPVTLPKPALVGEAIRRTGPTLQGGEKHGSAKKSAAWFRGRSKCKHHDRRYRRHLCLPIRRLRDVAGSSVVAHRYRKIKNCSTAGEHRESDGRA